jgi:hypothetical protein
MAESTDTREQGEKSCAYCKKPFDLEKVIRSTWAVVSKYRRKLLPVCRKCMER